MAGALLKFVSKGSSSTSTESHAASARDSAETPSASTNADAAQPSSAGTNTDPGQLSPTCATTDPGEEPQPVQVQAETYSQHQIQAAQTQMEQLLLHQMTQQFGPQS